MPLTYSDQTSALSVWPARRPARRSTTPNQRASTPHRTQRTTSPIRPDKVGPPPAPSSSETMWTPPFKTPPVAPPPVQPAPTMPSVVPHRPQPPMSGVTISGPNVPGTCSHSTGHPDTRPSGAYTEPDWRAGTGTYERGGDHHDRSTHSSVAYSQHSGTTSPPTIWRLP